MFLSMNWISDFVDLSGLDKVELIHQFSLSTAEVENEIFFKGSELSGVVVAEIKSIEIPIIPLEKQFLFNKIVDCIINSPINSEAALFFERLKDDLRLVSVFFGNSPCEVTDGISKYSKITDELSSFEIKKLKRGKKWM